MKPLKGKATRNGADRAEGGKGKNGAAGAAPDPTKPDSRDRHAVLERTLERYPWTKLSDDRGDQAQLKVLLGEAGDNGASWMVIPDEKHRVPGPLDADVYVALGQLYNSQIPLARRAEERTVRPSVGELASVMRKERGGTTYTCAIARPSSSNVRRKITPR